MLIPPYWAEARLERPRTKEQKRIVVRRYGWSETNQADAQQMADQRARDAMARAVAGTEVFPLEWATPYNGADGMPIREEILGREGDVVLTRNSYGAICLNTPDVLFADIDFNREMGCGPVFKQFAGLFILIVILSIKYHSRALFVFGTLAAAILAPLLAKLIHRIVLARQPNPEQVVRQRLASFLRKRATWHVRLYRSPAGFRALVMHRTFDPHAPEVIEFFDALEVDQTYAQMCKNQRCFRARVSPKPWRIGIKKHLRPRDAVWPIKPEKLPLREEWVRKYDEAARGFASCQFIDTVGSRTVDPKTAAVRDLHDRLAKATSGLPIA